MFLSLWLHNKSPQNSVAYSIYQAHCTQHGSLRGCCSHLWKGQPVTWSFCLHAKPGGKSNPASSTCSLASTALNIHQSHFPSSLLVLRGSPPLAQPFQRAAWPRESNCITLILFILFRLLEFNPRTQSQWKRIYTQLVSVVVFTTSKAENSLLRPKSAIDWANKLKLVNTNFQRA